MHSLDALCMCVGEFTEISGRISTQIRQWKVVETGEMIDVDVPDNVMIHGAVATGAVVSAHIATVPTATPGFRMEIYGREGALHVSTPGAVQRDANALAGSLGRAPLAPMDVPSAYLEVPAETPAGPPRNVAALSRRLGNAVTHGAVLEPDFEHALIRHRLMDAIGCV